MKFIKCISIVPITYVSIIGCSGNYGKLKPQSRSESQAIQQELIDNWTEYRIYYTGSYYARPFKARAIVFEKKNDNRKILVVRNNWNTVIDQKTWMEVIKANTTTQGDFDLSPYRHHSNFTEVYEIWGPDNQRYGAIIHQSGGRVNAKVIDENTMQVKWRRPEAIGSPVK